MNLYEVVKYLCDTEQALEHMDSKYENPIDTAMRISRITTLHDVIDRLMYTDEYQEGLNTTKVSSGIPTLTFEEK